MVEHVQDGPPIWRFPQTQPRVVHTRDRVSKLRGQLGEHIERLARTDQRRRLIRESAPSVDVAERRCAAWFRHAASA
jgi:hypothetical protein